MGTFDLNTCLQPKCSVASFLLLSHSGGTDAAETNSPPTSCLSTLPHPHCSIALSQWEYGFRLWSTAERFLFCWLSRSPHEVAKDQGSHAWGQSPNLLSTQHHQLGLNFLGERHSPSSVGTGLPHAFPSGMWNVYLFC